MQLELKELWLFFREQKTERFKMVCGLGKPNEMKKKFYERKDKMRMPSCPEFIEMNHSSKVFSLNVKNSHHYSQFNWCYFWTDSSIIPLSNTILYCGSLIQKKKIRIVFIFHEVKKKMHTGVQLIDLK
jgi:hypothetical protein